MHKIILQKVSCKNVFDDQLSEISMNNIQKY